MTESNRNPLRLLSDNMPDIIDAEEVEDIDEAVETPPVDTVRPFAYRVPAGRPSSTSRRHPSRRRDD